MCHSRGKNVIIGDSDGATEINCESLAGHSRRTRDTPSFHFCYTRPWCGGTGGSFEDGAWCSDVGWKEGRRKERCAGVDIDALCSVDGRIEEEICWICHDGPKPGAQLESPCRCKSMKAHRACLARWQLQQAGKAEERKCRFCQEDLPDWKQTHHGLPKATPIMTVVHDGITHQVAVEPGDKGQVKFQADIRRIFGLEETDAIQLTFGCRVPGSGQEVTLEGWESFDAAVHCAAISAGERELRQKPTPSRSNSLSRKISNGSGVLRRLFSKHYIHNMDT
eukprot:jgi/Picsp_1/6257/NSC_03611-R1_protein